MSTQIHIEIEGHPAHTATLPMDLKPTEKARIMQALCYQVRFLQLWLESEQPEKPHDLSQS